MIDWDSPKWGSGVHESETGSWLPDWREGNGGDPS